MAFRVGFAQKTCVGGSWRQYATFLMLFQMERVGFFMYDSAVYRINIFYSERVWD